MRQVVAINDRCTISYCAQRPIVRSIVATDRTINRDGWRPMVRSIVASCDRSYEQSLHPPCDRSYELSWHPVTECTINCGTRRPIVDQSWGATIDRTINRSIVRPIVRFNRGTKRSIVRLIVASCEPPYDQSCDYRSAIIHNRLCHHAQLVVRSRKTYLRTLTIWNRSLEVLNMTTTLLQLVLP